MDNISASVSKKFRFVSTLSMLAVVFIHAKFIMSRWNGFMDKTTLMGKVSDVVQFTISEQICRLAVPLFFLISGFFMAYHNDGSFKQYLSRVQSRTKSLMVPYLLFSSVWLVISVTAGIVKINNIGDFIYYVVISPIPFQFWFLQHLMVLVLISILLYRLIKSFYFSSIIMLGIIYLMESDIRTGFGGSLFYYGIGMSLCINPLRGNVRCKSLLSVVFIFLCVACALNRYFGIDIGYVTHSMVSKVMILCGVCYCVWWILFDKISFNIPQWLSISSGTSFFIFCIHEPLLSFMKSMYLHIFSAQCEILVGYFILPFLTITLCLIVDNFVKKASLKLYKVLTGGR